MRCVLALVFVVPPLASALLNVKNLQEEHACAAEDTQHRAQLQNKLAGVCEEMCKQVGAYPKCAQCPGFVAPDSTPGVMTWDELLEYMDNLVSWGADTVKGWHKQASALQKSQHAALSVVQKKQLTTDGACAAEDLMHRSEVQNKLAGVCEDMCKSVGAYPNCAQCPGFVQPDSTPGVMTWDELLEYMDNLVAWGQDTIKAWHKEASAIQKDHHAVLSVVEARNTIEEKSCTAEDLQQRTQLQNKLAQVCEEMCKQVGAYPNCAQCPAFVAPDSTPGVMTWDELLEHMDNLVAWGQDTIKAWHKEASALQTS